MTLLVALPRDEQRERGIAAAAEVLVRIHARVNAEAAAATDDREQ